MFLISIITLILSTLLQGISSNFINYRLPNLSIFYTVYLLINLIIILPYFENDNKYLLLLVIFGLITDIAYTNTFVINTILFILIYKLNKFFFKVIPYNIFTLNISSLLSIMIYNILSFIILIATSYDNYSISMLFNVLTHSILMTIIYTSIMYLIIDYLNKKFDLRNVR